MIALHATIAIVAIVGLIIWCRVSPMISIVLGSVYLGLAAGLGFEGTITTITEGFGSIMAEVGLLIGFGVLIGSLLFALGALQRLVELLLRIFGTRGLPYTLATVLSSVFASIYGDVRLVLTTPLARSAAPRLGRLGLPKLAGTLAASIPVGDLFVVPGLGIVAIAGLMNVPLGTMLLYGLLIGPATAVITTFLFGCLLKIGFWDSEKDETVGETTQETEEAQVAAGGGYGRTAVQHSGGDAVSASSDSNTASTVSRVPPLFISLLPVLAPLVLIALGAIAEAVGVTLPVIAFVGNPTLALFLGLGGAYLLSRRIIGVKRTGEVLSRGFNTTGQILLVTGIGGSLGAVIKETNLDKILGGMFSVEVTPPVIVTILLAWFIAALLHLAIGSVTVAAITAAGILGPIMAGLSVSPVIVCLAIASGAMFALQVNSNFFWMFQTLFSLTTRGALKALTFVSALASVVSLPLIVLLSLFV